MTLSFTANRATIGANDDVPAIALKLSGVESELNIWLPTSDLHLLDRIHSTRWEHGALKLGSSANAHAWWSYSDHAIAVPHALRGIGADQTAAIVQRALALFPNGAPPTERFERQTLLEEIDPDCELFESLDNEFFAYPDDITAMLARFVRANRASIRGS